MMHGMETLDRMTHLAWLAYMVTTAPERRYPTVTQYAQKINVDPFTVRRLVETLPGIPRGEVVDVYRTLLRYGIPEKDAAKCRDPQYPET